MKHDRTDYSPAFQSKFPMYHNITIKVNYKGDDRRIIGLLSVKEIKRIR